MFHVYIPAYAPCSGRAQAGTANLQLAILERFDRSFDYGIYNCRPLTTNASIPSIHSDGRAGDTGFPDAVTGLRSSVTTPHSQGFLLVEALRRNAWDLGIMGIIWNRRRWDWRTPWGREYLGPNPHVNHVHWEQTHAYASDLTYTQAQRLIGEPPMPFTYAEELALKQVAPYAYIIADLAKALTSPGPTTGKIGSGQSLIHVLETYRLVGDNAGVSTIDHQAMARLLGQ